MRRKDRAIGDRARIDEIIARCPVCHLGVISQGEPYVVPLSFGYDGTAVLLHMAREGRKLEALRKADHVCLQWDLPGEIVTAAAACGWGTRYESVLAWGSPQILDDPEEKRSGLGLIMAHYAEPGSAAPWTYDDATLARTVVVRIVLDAITGKARD